MLCEHDEDVCQFCLSKKEMEKLEETEKVDKIRKRVEKLEEIAKSIERIEKEEEIFPRGTRTLREKINALIISSIALPFFGFAGFWSSKLLLKTLLGGVFITKELLETLLAPLE